MTLATRTLKEWDGRYPSAVTLIYLLRHAESVANEKGVLAGRSDVGLSKRGKLQALAIAKSLKELKLDGISVSPIKRCHETVSPYLASSSGKNVPVEVNTDFQEMDYGTWSGRKLKILSLKRDWRKIQNTPDKFTFPHGESFSEAWDRVSQGLRNLAERFSGSKVLVVSHGDIIKMALAQTLGTELKQFQRIHVEPASLSAIELSKKRVVLFTNRTVVNGTDRNDSLKRNRKFMLGGGGS
jgi:probable phosphoglycerate mutase